MVHLFQMCWQKKWFPWNVGIINSEFKIKFWQQTQNCKAKTLIFNQNLLLLNLIVLDNHSFGFTILTLLSKLDFPTKQNKNPTVRWQQICKGGVQWQMCGSFGSHGQEVFEWTGKGFLHLPLTAQTCFHCRTTKGKGHRGEERVTKSQLQTSLSKYF